MYASHLVDGTESLVNPGLTWPVTPQGQLKDSTLTNHDTSR